jgi:hypothetical protein
MGEYVKIRRVKGGIKIDTTSQVLVAKEVTYWLD